MNNLKKKNDFSFCMFHFSCSACDHGYKKRLKTLRNRVNGLIVVAYIYNKQLTTYMESALY